MVSRNSCRTYRMGWINGSSRFVRPQNVTSPREPLVYGTRADTGRSVCLGGGSPSQVPCVSAHSSVGSRLSQASLRLSDTYCAGFSAQRHTRPAVSTSPYGVESRSDGRHAAMHTIRLSRAASLAAGVAKVGEPLHRATPSLRRNSYCCYGGPLTGKAQESNRR